MTDGNRRLGVYVDDQATDEQLDKLVKVFGGLLGGPMGALAPLVGEVVGVERAAIEVMDDGLRHSVRVGSMIDFEWRRRCFPDSPFPPARCCRRGDPADGPADVCRALAGRSRPRIDRAYEIRLTLDQAAG
jgi:hypothetical protein